MNTSTKPGQVQAIVTIASLLVTFFLGFASPVRADLPELFFSEYVEGSSYNKALEIYNGTGLLVNLAAGNYTIEIYFDGNTSPGTTIALTGTVAAGDVYVVADDGAATAILAETDQTSTASSGRSVSIPTLSGVAAIPAPRITHCAARRPLRLVMPMEATLLTRPSSGTATPRTLLTGWVPTASSCRRPIR